jgi:HEXXH motif-containing protein
VEAEGLRLRVPHALPFPLARAAEDLIGLLPSLSRIAEQSISAVHLLSAEPGFDISHSEPRWRSTIFVSMPERTDGVGNLRFAEGVIHEAMHLHLTNAEEVTPLVNDFDGRMPSPWRAEARTYQGVLHALFVFACLAAFFRQIRRWGGMEQDGCQSHVGVRLSEIQSEMARLDVSRLIAGLTARGAELAGFWHTMAADADPAHAA